MTEKTKAPLTVAKGNNDSHGANTTEATTPEIIPTLEELQRENRELKLKLSTIPEDLEKKIEYFNRKRLLIKRFDSLTEKRDSLLKHLDQIAEISAKNEFVNDKYSVSINSAENGYSAKEVFKIQNPTIIGEVLNFMISKIEQKQTEIQIEIEA